MKPLIVTKKENGKFDIQILKSIARQGVGEYTHMVDLDETSAKKIVEDIKADKSKRLAAITEMITTELDEIETILSAQFII
jgi:ribosomal protein S17E